MKVFIAGATGAIDACLPSIHEPERFHDATNA